MSGEMKLFTSRAELLDHIWDKMKVPFQIKKNLIFFGGISTKLRREDADNHYIQWLTANPEARLFICYETEENAQRRSKMLDKKIIIGSPDDNTFERMQRKEREVKELQERLTEKLRKLNQEKIEERMHFIALEDQFLTNYVIAADNDVFFTPLIAKRSTETVSFNVNTFSPIPHQYVCGFLEYIQYYIEVTVLNHESDKRNLAKSFNFKNIRVLYDEINRILSASKDRK